MFKIAKAVAVGLTIMATAEVTRAADAPRTVTLQRLVMQVPVGVQLINKQEGIFCLTNADDASSRGDRREISVTSYLTSFRNAFAAAGLHPEEEANLFARDRESSSDYALAGIVTDERLDVCEPISDTPNYDKDPPLARPA